MKKWYFIAVIIILIGFFLWSTSNSIPDLTINQSDLTIKQGVYGTVKLTSGDCMPGTDSSCKTSYASRTIYIREPASMKDMNIVYLKNKTELIKQIQTDDNGFYQAELPDGRYSVFVEDTYTGEAQEYCNFFDGSGGACQIYIESNLVKYDITIDHSAV
jgi:hypothetical protein